MKISKAKKQTEHNKAKRCETREKKKKVREQWVRLCCYSCFASKFVSFVSTETPKLAVSLFREAIETNLFVLDSVKTSFCSIVVCFFINRFRGTP